MTATATVNQDTVFVRLDTSGNTETIDVKKGETVTIIYNPPTRYTIVDYKGEQWMAFDDHLD